MNLVRPSTWLDVEYLSTRLRPADLAELEAAGKDPLTALSSGLDSPGVCLTGIAPDTGNPCLMFGAAQSPVAMVGYVWLLGSSEVERHVPRFLRESKAWVEALNDQWPILTNAVFEENTLHRRWLRWLDFQFVRPAALNNRFIEFVRLKCVNPPPSQR